MRAPFRALGKTLLLETDSDAILAIAEDAFGRFGPADALDEPEVTLQLLADGPPDGEIDEPVFRTDGLLLLQTAGRGAILTIDPVRGLAWGSFSPAALANPPFFRSHFLLMGFLSMLQSRGLMAVHGSALVKDGRAVLLRGPSGSGKTTLAYAGARARFQALAEDVVWVDPAAGLWRGIPWHFHLMPDAPRLFPELTGRPAILTSAGKMKLEVDLDSVRPGATAVTARPGPVVLLERTADPESRLEPLDPEEARASWRGASAGLEGDFPDYEAHVKTLLAGGAWRLRSGTDPERSLDLLEALLA